ncbi:hypothetical protein Tco_0150190 [Tanacetum coccineum]
MRDGRSDNHASQIYMSDDTLMCDPMEANYVQGYHDQKPIDSNSYPTQNPQFKNQNQMPHPSKYFKLSKTLTEKTMREWMANQIEANEGMKNQVVELEHKVNQGLRNHQAIIENLERQFEYLVKIQQTESLPRTISTKPRHEVVYKPPSIRNKKDKGDVKFIEEDETQPIPTMPNPNLIHSNSPTVLLFLKDCTMHIQYTNAKTFVDDVFLNHVGDKELKSMDGVGTGRITKKRPRRMIRQVMMEEGALRQNRLFLHAYASFCVAFIIWSSIAISHA